MDGNLKPCKNKTMIHSKLEQVLTDAENSWNKHNMGKGVDTLGKCAFMFGYLQKRYESAYQDLPDNKKEGWNGIDKIVYIDANNRAINGTVYSWDGKEWINKSKITKHQKAF